jgi:hypothetical protein
MDDVWSVRLGIHFAKCGTSPAYWGTLSISVRATGFGRS